MIIIEDTNKPSVSNNDFPTTLINTDPPLCFAVKFELFDIVKKMVNNKEYDINEADSCGRTPLYHAVINNQLSMVKFLIEAGANVDKANNEGVTPLFRAAYTCDILIVKFLIEAGADINKANDKGKTPLCGLVARIESELSLTNAPLQGTVNLLLSSGAEVPENLLCSRKDIKALLDLAKVIDKIFSGDLETKVVLTDIKFFAERIEGKLRADKNPREKLTYIIKKFQEAGENSKQGTQLLQILPSLIKEDNEIIKTLLMLEAKKSTELSKLPKDVLPLILDRASENVGMSLEYFKKAQATLKQLKTPFFFEEVDALMELTGINYIALLIEAFECEMNLNGRQSSEDHIIYD